MPPLTILLIDPDDDNRAMYAEYLRARGMRVVAAATTAAALLKARTADVIVTGIRLGGRFDGVELVRRMRASRQTAHARIIVLTACAFEPDRQRAMAAGCDSFLAKPCLPDHLEDEIRKLLSRRRGASTEPPRLNTASRRPKPRVS